MRVRHYLLSIMAMTLSLVAVACGENKEVPHESEGNITLSAEILTVSYEKQTQNITVDADGEWGVYPQIDWVKAQPSGGVKGTTNLKITIEENKTGDVREGVLEFRRKGKTIELRVKQNYDIEAVAIADENFLAALVESYDTDGDGILSTKEASEIRKIECSGKGISNMSELSTYFTEITYLNCSNNSLTELDVTKLTKLEYLDCSGNNLTELDIQRLQKLTTLDCTDNANLAKIYVWFNFVAPDGFTKPETAEYVEPSIAAPEGYELVWHDEFDTAGVSSPSTDNWWYETGDGGWGNNELQDYVSGGKYNGVRIAEVSDGTLKITAQKIDGKVRSVRMNTVQSWTYGYFEGRLKLCKGKGTWPAFWMMPKNFRAWPDDGEIDIMEHVGSIPNRASFALHTVEKNGTRGNNWHATKMFDYSLADDFHTYAVEWAQEEKDGKDVIRFFVDGVQYAEQWEAKIDNNDSWPFNKPHFIILNLAIGGTMGGSVDDAIFNVPRIMYVDYVRVYQRTEK